MSKVKKSKIDGLLIEERKRIGEELHRYAAQSLSHALFLLSVYEKKKKKAEIERVRQAIKRALREIRHTISKSRNEAPWPLTASIRDILSDFRERFGIIIQLRVIGDEACVASDTHHTLLMLIQEGLMNVIKHSKATSCHISLDLKKAHIKLSIQDNGIGFRNTPHSQGALHFGLKFMKERVLKMGGRIKIDSAKEKGTTLSFVLPSQIV